MFKRIPVLSRTTSALALLLAATFATPAAAQDLAQTLGQAAGVPQIPAFLPDQYSVAKTEALPIDGVWLVNTIRKKIRIEAGRAYAIDSWLHLFVLKVQPGMVVIRDFRRTAPGRYTAQDLPLMGQASMELTPQGNLAVSVQGALGPVRYELQRLESQYPEALNAELSAAGLGTGAPAPPPVSQPPGGPLPGMPPQPPPGQTPPPVAPLPAPAPTPAPPADCKAIGIDPDTGATICA